MKKDVCQSPRTAFFFKKKIAFWNTVYIILVEFRHLHALKPPSGVSKWFFFRLNMSKTSVVAVFAQSHVSCFTAQTRLSYKVKQINSM